MASKTPVAILCANGIPGLRGTETPRVMPVLLRAPVSAPAGTWSALDKLLFGLDSACLKAVS